jgi:transaldolase
MEEIEKSPLFQMSRTTSTQYWNDSCSVEELIYAIDRGAVGATSNPTIVLNVLKSEINLWDDHVKRVIRTNPDWNETRVSWKIFEDVTISGAKLLQKVFDREGGKCGRMSIQTDPANYVNSKAILEQTMHFNTLGANMQIKVPATKAGIEIVEEATYQGANLNVTVSFTVPQVIAVAEAVERGLKRRDKEGLDTSLMSPVATLMVGRLDDWCKVVVKRDNIDINPEYLEWCGVACVKNAYRIFKERGYRTRLLPAAYRNFYHWTEFVGGDISLTIPYEWQKKFNESNVKPEPRMDIPVAAEIVDTLYSKIPDFKKAYDEKGMTIPEFDGFGATIRTLRGFIQSWHDFTGVIREYMLPNPDVRH